MPGGVGSGRKPKSAQTRQIQQTLTEAGVYGAKIIRDLLRGTDAKHRKVKPVSLTKLKAAITAIDHAIGLPKAKIHLKTDALTVKEISELAASWGENAEEFEQTADVLTVPLPPETAQKEASNAKN